MYHIREQAGLVQFTEICKAARERLGLVFNVPPDTTTEASISGSDLRDLATMQNIFYPTKFVSHRRFLGRFIVLFKEQVVKVMDPYLRRRLRRQFEINQFSWTMAQLIRKQSEQITELKARIERLESRSHQ